MLKDWRFFRAGVFLGLGPAAPPNGDREASTGIIQVDSLQPLWPAWGTNRPIGPNRQLLENAEQEQLNGKINIHINFFGVWVNF